MIPDPDVRERPPLSLELVFVLALLAPLFHSLAVMVLLLVGFRGLVPVVGMGALLSYGAIFAWCAARFSRPPTQQLALLVPPPAAWVALLFLLPSIVLSSELDNWVKVWFPPPPAFADPAAPFEPPPFLGPTLAIVFVVVLPLAYELFFRGVLQPLAAARLGVIGGVVLTAVLSGVARGATGFGTPWEIAPACATALVLCILRQATGSLWPPIGLHVLIGLTALAAQYGLFGIPGFDDMSAPHTPAPWLAGAALSTAIGFGLCRAASRTPAS
jgi:membrane protease YdiL (CAAX protease family)